MTLEKFDALDQLLSCYFHQDWVDEFGSYQAVIQAIRISETEERIAESASEIADLLAAEPSELNLRKILVEQIGCYFEPKSIGLDYRQWLEKVRHELANK